MILYTKIDLRMYVSIHTQHINTHQTCIVYVYNTFKGQICEQRQKQQGHGFHNVIDYYLGWIVINTSMYTYDTILYTPSIMYI